VTCPTGAAGRGCSPLEDSGGDGPEGAAEPAPLSSVAEAAAAPANERWAPGTL